MDINEKWLNGRKHLSMDEEQIGLDGANDTQPHLNDSRMDGDIGTELQVQIGAIKNIICD
jgi:hypothetical protein